MTDRYAATLSALTSALEFVADHMDVVDGSEESGPRPNRAMTLQQELAPAVTDAYRLAKEHAEMLVALKAMTVLFGCMVDGNVEHEQDDCPEDDTCSCPNVAEIEAVLAAARVAMATAEAR